MSLAGSAVSDRQKPAGLCDETRNSQAETRLRLDLAGKKGTPLSCRNREVKEREGQKKDFTENVLVGLCYTH